MFPELGWREGPEVDSPGFPVGKVWQKCLGVGLAAVRKKSVAIIFPSSVVSNEGRLQQGEEKKVDHVVCCDEPQTGHSGRS